MNMFKKITGMLTKASLLRLTTLLNPKQFLLVRLIRNMGATIETCVQESFVQK
jgi:hypothetical protein